MLLTSDGTCLTEWISQIGAGPTGNVMTIAFTERSPSCGHTLRELTESI